MPGPQSQLFLGPHTFRIYERQSITHVTSHRLKGLVTFDHPQNADLVSISRRGKESSQ